jgi:hypothetical protein
MNITTIENKKRVVCEKTFPLWCQRGDPDFWDILRQINKECGSPNEIALFTPPLNQPPANHEMSCSIHDVEITIIYCPRPEVGDVSIKTIMFCQNAQHSWMQWESEKKHFINYFRHFLEYLREVWHLGHPSKT